MATSHDMDDFFQQAFALQLAGEWGAAQTHYEKILKAAPQHVPSLTNLGILHMEFERAQEAIPLLAQSLALDPDQPNAHYVYANALRARKQYEKAIEHYDTAIKLNPNEANYFSDRGTVLFFLKRNEEALASFDAAIALNPKKASFYCDRGVICMKMKRYDEALAYYDCAIALAPDYADAHNNRGNALRDMRRFAEALVSYDRAIMFQPQSADMHNNQGNALRAMGLHTEALLSYNRAIALQPDLADAYSNRGALLVDMHRFDEAKASYAQALAIDPHYIGAQWNQALLALLLGEFEEGLQRYEKRWKLPSFAKVLYPFPQPLWLGKESLAGKTIFVHLEQGIGDFIQFCRYIPLLEVRGAMVILEVLPVLMPLIATLSPTITLIAKGTPHPTAFFDFHIPLLSLPLAFGTTLATIPNHVPYLSSDAAKLATWEKRLGEKTHPRVGLVWSGARKHLNDHNRSIPLALLAPLLQQPYAFHALQKDVRPEDAPIIARHGVLTHADDLQDFTDTAALVMAMDLVITVDTSVAHLAGALGKSVWILLPYAPDFRWLLNRDDTPWYPSARLFRQTLSGDWSSVVGRVIDALKAVV